MCNLVTDQFIITLCGSSLNKDLFLKVKRILTLKTKSLIFDLPFYSKADGIQLSADEIKILKEVHREKIKISDTILLLVDESWRIGESTKEEYDYAVSLGKEVMVIHGNDELSIHSIKDIIDQGTTNPSWFVVPNGDEKPRVFS